MKNRKMIFRVSVVLLLFIGVYSIVLRAGNDNRKPEEGSMLTFAPTDTLKPEVIQEKRITKIEIVNGKKKIVDKIVKMKGDSIIEEKTIEREEDADEDFGLGQMPQIQGFDFNQIDPGNLDSLLGMHFKHFNSLPFAEDSLFKSFGFDLNPGFHMGFGDSFMDDDALKNFFEAPLDPMMHDFTKQMEEFFQHSSPLVMPHGGSGYTPEEKRFKTLKEIIRDQLLDDGFINDFDDSFKFDINERELEINGKKQPDAVYEKYKKVIEDNSGLDLEDDFEYKFRNSKSLKSGMRRL